MKYTIAKFYRVTGHSTQKRGISPDIPFKSFFDHFEIGESRLDNVLAWDKIPAQKIVNNGVNIKGQIPKLMESSSTRLKSSEAYQKLITDIDKYGKIVNEKFLSLNKEKRLKKRKEDEYWSKRVNEVVYSYRVDSKDKDKKEDLYLSETLNIVGDLFSISK